MWPLLDSINHQMLRNTVNPTPQTPNVGLRWKIARLAESIDSKLADGSLLVDAADRKNCKRLREVLVERKPLSAFSGINVSTIANIELGRTNHRSTIAGYFKALLDYIDALSVKDRSLPDWLDFPIGTWANGTGTLCGLLDPELRAVGFHGESRKETLTGLKNWCTSDHPVALRSLKAEAGMGKTRLGVELCCQLVDSSDEGSAEPWSVGFVRPTRFPAGASPWSTANLAGRNLLMVFDYAGGPESLPLIKHLLPSLLEPPTRRTRLLFLDRTDFWLSELRSDSGFQALKRRHSISREFGEPDLGDAYGKDGRIGAFNSAVLGFKHQLQATGSVAVPANLDSPTFDRVLLLHMRALLAVTGPTQAEKMTEVLKECMDRECRQWLRRMAIRGLDPTHLPLVERVYSLVAIEGGATDHENALAVASQDKAFGSLPPFVQDRVIGVLHDCYGSSRLHIEPLRPDLLGEYFVTRRPTKPLHSREK